MPINLPVLLPILMALGKFYRIPFSSEERRTNRSMVDAYYGKISHGDTRSSTVQR